MSPEFRSEGHMGVVRQKKGEEGKEEASGSAGHLGAGLEERECEGEQCHVGLTGRPRPCCAEGHENAKELEQLL